jgi:hypothetical protein
LAQRAVNKEHIIIEFKVNSLREQALHALRRFTYKLLFSIFVDILKVILIMVIKRLPGIERLLGGAVITLELPLFSAVVALILLARAEREFCYRTLTP